MKYANGNLDLNGKQIHAFACAKTYKRIKELLSEFHVNSYYFEGWWGKCANDKMVAVAKDKEGIWIEKERFTNEYEELKGAE